jgi:hypothetical protein
MSASASTRNVSPRSILVVETPQLPDILYLGYFGQDKETGTRPGGGGGGQMLVETRKPPTWTQRRFRAAPAGIMSDLSFRPGGALKLKGDGGEKKKK